MDVTKGLSLRLIFIKYLVNIGLALILVVVAVMVLLIGGMKMGVYVPANYIEQQVIAVERKIVSAPSFDEGLIPKQADYVFVNKRGKISKTNLSEGEAMTFLKEYKSAQNGVSTQWHYRSIKRSDGTCLVRYVIKPFYTVPWMNRYLPNVSIVVVLLTVISAFAVCLHISFRYARHLNRELLPLFKVAENIADKNLDFKGSFTKVKEFNQVLLAMDEMKSALKAALEEQWQTENERKEQISALAHDIKTPITIISGNAELLLNSSLDDKQVAYVQHILDNKDRIEDHIRALIELNTNDNIATYEFEHMNVGFLASILADDICEYADSHDVIVSYLVKVRDETEVVAIDLRKMRRAIINLVSNASRFADKAIEIEIETIADEFVVAVKDDGEGFSNEALKRAKERFYQGDKARGSQSNYGLGLYIADKIAKAHDGKVMIANRPRTGAEVRLMIPLVDKR